MLVISVIVPILTGSTTILRPMYALALIGLPIWCGGAWLLGAHRPNHNPEPAGVHRGASGLILIVSIAVLPFASLSDDPSDAYFAEGVHGDIISQLAGRKDTNQFGFFGSIVAALEGDAPATRRRLDAEECYARSINDAVLLKENSYNRMVAMLMLGERTTAFDLLEQALADPVGGGEVADAAQVAIDPIWKDHHDDPRFKAIIAKHRPKD